LKKQRQKGKKEAKFELKNAKMKVNPVFIRG
jgi:hypothetical protein